MSVSKSLRTLAGRLATFEKSQQVAKSRTSSAKKKTPSTVSWPHDEPSAEQLAKAGFFYKPSACSPDSVTCFLCNRALDGWEPDDNPIVEHLNHVPDCGWAINASVEQRMDDMDRAEENPTSEKMVEARLATFQDSWPHESKKGWKCKVQKMVAAGWYYCPLPEVDDCVACAYCGISLDGWEPKDDPKQEHLRRAPECHFFSLVDESAKLQAQTKTRKKRASRGARTSKSSRMSTQSIHVAHDDTQLDESSLDAQTIEGDSILTTISTTSKATKGRKKATKAKAAPIRMRTTRGQEKALLESSTLDVESTAAHECDDHLSTGTVTVENDLPPPKKRKQKGAPKKALAEDSILEDDGHIAEWPPERTAAKKGTKNKALHDDETQHETIGGTDDLARASTGLQPQARRGCKRMSDGTEKLDSSIMIIEEVDVPAKRKAKPKANTQQGKAKVQEKSTESSTESSETIVPGISHTMEDIVVLPQDPQNIDDIAINETQAQEERGKRAQADKTRKPSSQTRKKPPVAIYDEEQDVEQKQPTPSIEPEPKRRNLRQASATATDPAQAAREQTASSSSSIATPSQPAQVPTLPSPKPSPQLSRQSSDAENEPPSLRASKTSKLLPSAQKPITIPLKPQTPTTSPSKRRHILGNLTSNAPWTAADLDGIFQPWLGSATNSEGTGENVLMALTSPEKKMSVENWIAVNAGKAEEELRKRCEGMIGVA